MMEREEERKGKGGEKEIGDSEKGDSGEGEKRKR